MNMPLPDFATRTPTYWHPEVDEILICHQVLNETHDVKTFILGAEHPRVAGSEHPRQFRYQPGQFITLEMEIEGRLINRCYTISSTPTRPDRISITVKRIPEGIVSNWLHDSLKPGGNLRTCPQSFSNRRSMRRIQEIQTNASADLTVVS